jgi:hypothetical protein
VARDPKKAIDLQPCWPSAEAAYFPGTESLAGGRGRVIRRRLLPDRRGGPDRLGHGHGTARVGLEPLNEQGVMESLLPTRMDSIPGHAADVTGPQAMPQRTLAAVVKRDDHVWCFVLTGAAELVAEQKQSFEQFLQSVRFDGPDARPGKQ